MNDDFPFTDDLRQAIGRAQGGDTAPGWDSASLWARFVTRRANEGRSGLNPSRNRSLPNASRLPSSLLRMTGIWIAAAVLVIGITSIYTVSRNTIPASSTQTYTTQSGQHMSLVLDEGVRVSLAPATTIRIQKSKDSEAISIDVTGDALFSVQHATKRPITVTAYKTTTRVLGTEFSVQAYDSSSVRVAIREGRVAVQSSVTPEYPVVAGASQAVLVVDGKRPQVTSISDPNNDFAWADGRLVMRDVPLREVFQRLSRWYGFEFDATDDALLDMKLDAVFGVEFSDERMRAVAQSLGADVKRVGKHVIFSKSLD